MNSWRDVWRDKTPKGKFKQHFPTEATSLYMYMYMQATTAVMILINYMYSFPWEIPTGVTYAFISCNLHMYM